MHVSLTMHIPGFSAHFVCGGIQTRMAIHKLIYELCLNSINTFTNTVGPFGRKGAFEFNTMDLVSLKIAKDFLHLFEILVIKNNVYTK